MGGHFEHFSWDDSTWPLPALLCLLSTDVRDRSGDIANVQCDSTEWEPRKWEPSWNLPQFPSEKWELTYLGPGGLASVFCLP